MNHRILIWNTIPTANLTPADIVLGQPNMNSNTANNGGVTAHSLRFPNGAACNSDGKFAVTDYNNNRVLIWNTFPTQNQEDADVVLGQANFNSVTSNSGGISAHSLYFPYGVYLDNTRLIVSDGRNSRVLVFNNIPTTNQADADLVLGQPNLQTNTDNNANRLATTFSNTLDDIYSDGTRLFVADKGNNRILGWGQMPTANQQPADFVIGQPDFSTYTDHISDKRFREPTSMSIYNNSMYLSDQINGRILIIPIGPQDTNVTVNNYISSVNVILSLTASDAKQVIVSDNSDFLGADWENFSTTKQITLSNLQDGQKTLYVKYKDYANFESPVLTASTILDTMPSDVANAEVSAPSNSAVLSFSTTEATSVYADYGLTNNYGSTTTEINTSPRTIPHTITLPNLLNCTNYHYRITAIDAAGNTTTGNDQTFTSLGCTGQSLVVGQTAVSVNNEIGATIAYTRDSREINLVVPPNYASENSVFQIKALEKATVIETVGNPEGVTAIGSNIYNLSALIDTSTRNTSFNSPITVTMTYTADDIATVNENELKIYRWDGSNWHALSNIVIDRLNKKVIGTTTAFSDFGLFGPVVRQENKPYCNDSKPVSAPDLFQIDTTQNTAKIFFTPIVNNDRYAIYFSTNPSAEEHGSVVTLGREGVQNFTVKSLKANTTYYFKVRGQNGCMPGDWSNIIKVKTNSQKYYKSLWAKITNLKPVKRVLDSLKQTAPIQTEVSPTPTVARESNIQVNSTAPTPVPPRTDSIWSKFVNLFKLK